MRRREFIGLRLSESESDLTLSEKRFCRQSGDMWRFDSASPWKCLLSARRREFISLLCGTATAWPLDALAQQAERVRRIGVIMGFSAEDEVWQAYATFRGRLQELGWAGGQNLRIDYRFVGDSTERTRIAAEELVALKSGVIFVSTNPVVTAVSQATHTIPIVFTWVSDSVGSGYVKSLAHPGGNITGFHNYEPALGSKWLEALKEVAPSVRRVAVVHVLEIAANAFIRAAEASSKGSGCHRHGSRRARCRRYRERLI